MSPGISACDTHLTPGQHLEPSGRAFIVFTNFTAARARQAIDRLIELLLSSKHMQQTSLMADRTVSHALSIGWMGGQAAHD
jgi:hypothetical protein